MQPLPDDDVSQPVPTAIERRDVMKLGAGVVAAAMMGQTGSAQQGGASPKTPAYDPGPVILRDPRGESSEKIPAPPRYSPPPAVAWRPHTGPGYQNDANRLGGNGPIDETTRNIVQFVKSYKESDMTPAVIKAVNRTMVDTIASLISGFEEESVRVAARVAARYAPAGSLKSTILGYGISTTPEVASFAAATMIQVCDFSHGSLIAAALAVGEAVRATGPQVMAAVNIGYEVGGAVGRFTPKSPTEGWYEHEYFYSGISMGTSVTTAVMAGKLFGLDADRLANAISIALTSHIAMNKGVGVLSMYKACLNAEAVKCGVWAAMLAKEGLTGPAQPFQGVGGLWYHQGGLGREVKLPGATPRIMTGLNALHKKFPSDGLGQAMIRITPQIRAWTKADEIASIDYYLPFLDWEENGDAPKWDPRNRETADHSIPYVLARNLISGESYLDAFALDKLPFRDPEVRALINKINLWPVAEWRGIGTGSAVIKKKSGEQKAFDTHNGARDETQFPPMTDEEITEKFKRVCTYKKVSDAQRDKGLAQWWNLGAVKDIAEPIRNLANFGKPMAL